MLARGILCRLAADVPKTSTHDIPQLAHLLQRSPRARSAVGLPAVCALSHASKTALSISRRSYATTRATRPTATVKKAVKKAGAKKPAAKKPTAKKAAPKKKAAVKKPTSVKKAAPKKKKKAVAVKPKPKPKRRVKKVPTAEEKQKASIRELKVKALRGPSSGSSVTAWTVFSAESVKAKDKATSLADAVKSAATRFKSLTPAEKEHYNHLANERAVAAQAEYKRWVLSHTPDEIRIANNARLLLRRKLKAAPRAGKRLHPPNTTKIQDDRQVKRPLTAYTRFMVERMATGDLKSIGLAQSAKLVANEWKALSASEKKVSLYSNSTGHDLQNLLTHEQKYEDATDAEKQVYLREKEKTYGHV
ncbi:hypothetical protein BCR34DRAFT_490048 [Clohesyomyces aquaticus]|uniref:HMG box domain-containing protein n=1 Tax=Clohesyomyces aquaticus TaxID=1231657 RepID=A0A1Y1Z895_9PLEO|nr:hypothetical protein BCR34DRAFT_490048 [Clohesyomyces aquaticus]